MNNPGILALSIYKDSDGTTYQLDGSKIAPDSEGYVVERNISPTARGTERKKNAKHTFEIRHNDESFHTSLTADSEFGDDVWQLAIAEFNGFVLWYEDSGVNCTVEEAYVDPENEGFPYTIRMVSFGSAIARGTNLSYAYAKTQGFATAWDDTDANNIADSWEESSVGASYSFAGDTQEISVSGTNRGIRQVVKFPLTGIDLAYSMEQVSGRDDGMLIRMDTYSFSSIITTTQKSIPTVSTGRQFVTATTDSNTFIIYFRYLSENSGSGDLSGECRFPSVRLNGSTEYIDG